MAVVNPTAAGESNEVDLSDKLATREVPPTKNTSHLGGVPAPHSRRTAVVAPLDLALNLGHRAVEYARTLGFDPAPDFAAPGTTSCHGRGRAPITFGRDGKPHFIHGPHDNPTSIVSRLRRSVGPDDFEYLIAG